MRKLTQDDLAKAVDVTRQTIISLENGKYIASLQLAHRLAKFFDTAKVIRDTKCTDWLFLENFYATLPIRNIHKDFYEIMRKDIEIARNTFDIAA